MDYVVTLGQFEGPMDLLLHLIQRSKVDIRDIFVSQITDQYLSYIEDMDGLDMDSASHFLQMAAYLLEIKSRSLLPRVDEDMLDPEEEQRQLIRLLEEYAAIKAVSQPLMEREERAIRRLYRLPEEMLTQETIDPKSLSIDKLFSAMLALMARGAIRTSAAGIRRLNRESVSIQSMIKSIKARLKALKRLTFDSLFTAETADRDEVVAAFLAVLELMREGNLHIFQERPFAQIELMAGRRRKDG